MKVLVSSISKNFGGVESLFLNLKKTQTFDDIQLDFICSDVKAAREKSFLELNCKIFHVTQPSKSVKRYFLELTEIFQREKYDIYHVNLTRFRFPLDIIIAKKNNVKIILHCHSTKIYLAGTFFGRIVRKIEQPIFKLITLKLSNLNIACSKNAADYMFDNRQYKVLHNGIELKKYIFSEEKRNEIREEFGLSGRIVLGHVGRFSDEKNHIFMLHILAELVKMNSNYRLMCIGDGELLPSIKNKIDELDLKERVLLLGEREDVADLLNAMDLFIFPSKHEALPLTLIEAQMNGLPCVVSECITEEVIVSSNLIKLPLDTIDKWPIVINQMSHQLVDRCDIDSRICQFDVENISDKMREIYKTVIKSE